jgi:signal transduction histidine kinase
VGALDAPIRRAYAVLSGAIVVSVLLGLIASSVVARTITRPMRELEAAALRMGRGEVPAPPVTALPEIGRVGSALVAAQREREALLVREREATRQAQEARQQAEAANRMKDEFLAMLAHELRNPLAAISSASALLDLAADSGADAGSGSSGASASEHARGVIRRQVGHMAHLTDDLLNVGRVMTGKIELKRVSLDLAAAVTATVRTLHSTGVLDGHRLALDLQPAWVHADVARLEQVISNLVSNAVKYTPAGGEVHVSVREETGQAVLRVTDSGVGIEPELLPHVFDLFVQGKRSLDRSQGGLGIGLTLVRRLTELHGGSAQARSDGAGRGAEFTVRLPAIAAPRPVAAAGPHTGAANGLRVLLIEDNEDLRATLRSVLALKGHEVLEAADGRNGVELVLREKPDVALVDIGLPLLDGYGVARAVRAQLDGSVRLIAMTGYGSETDVDSGLAAGFDGYLIKPVDLQQLERVLVRP